MLKARWMALLVIGMLISATGFADDVNSSNTDSKPQPVITHSIDSLLAESQYESRWQPIHPLEARAYSDDWPRPIAEFDFRDGSALTRVNRLRSLSLLTLAEIGQIRLFFGVNDDGFVGLHFRAFPRRDDQHHLEVVRMPYLNKNEPAGASSSPSR